MRLLIVLVLVAALLPVAYVGSYAPVCGAMRAGWMTRSTLHAIQPFWEPLETWMWHGSGSANDLYWQWHLLWDG